MRSWWIAALLLVPFSGCMGSDDVTPRTLATLGTLFPFDPVERGDPAPIAIDDCQALLSTLNDRALDQSRVSLEQSVQQIGGWGGWRGDVMVDSDIRFMAAGAAEDSSSDAPAEMTTSASINDAQVTGTNNQEADADEADFLKTDGKWTYVIQQGALQILRSDAVGDITLHATIPLEQAWGAQILLERRDIADPADDRLVLITGASEIRADARLLLAPDSMPAYNGLTHVVVLSLADRSNPVTEREFWVEGNFVDARLVDGVAHVIVNQWEGELGLRTWAGPDEEDLRKRFLDWDSYNRLDPSVQEAVRKQVALEADRANQELLADLTLADHMPAVYESESGLAVQAPMTDEQCAKVLATPEGTSRLVTTILSVDAGEDLDDKSTTFLGGGSIVYASGRALVLAGASQDTWWMWAQPELTETTDLHWFDLDGLSVTHRASGRVIGSILDSFALDVEGDQLRVATTTGSWGRWWIDAPEPMVSHVAVFDAEGGALVQRGIVGGIAPDERIWSVRFTPERAYVITFEVIRTDPLWVIDLTGPAPKILGELEIPGVSTYIHPVGNDKLLAIGHGPGPDGIGADFSTIQLSLFDVSDPEHPTRSDVLDLVAPGQSAWTDATSEHKAFTYWDAIGQLAVPMTMSTYWEGYENGAWTTRSEQRLTLQVINVDLGAEDLTLRGDVDQRVLQNQNVWGQGIQRSYFLGTPGTTDVSLYAVSPLGVTAHDLDTLTLQDAAAFQVQEQVYYYDDVVMA